MFDLPGRPYRLRLQVGAFCVVFFIFAASAYAFYREAKYFLFGTSVQASLSNIEAQREVRRGETTSILQLVSYSFPDLSGEVRRESDLMPQSWQPPQNAGAWITLPAPGGSHFQRAPQATIAVQYIPGKPGWSRLVGHDQRGFTIPFLAAAVGIAGPSLALLHGIQRARATKSIVVAIGSRREKQHAGCEPACRARWNQGRVLGQIQACRRRRARSRPPIPARAAAPGAGTRTSWS